MDYQFSDNSNSAEYLAQSGGAPLLAHIALGANVKDTLASHFGAGDYDSWYKNLNGQDQSLIDGIRKQLEQIQTNTDLRNKAVQNIVNDFPGITAQAAQARKASGAEFDDVTKGYIDQALQGTAAKFAANGGLSSGAMAAATARVGADYGMDKLNYMDQRGDEAYNQGVQGWQTQYNEAKGSQTFQQEMLQTRLKKTGKAIEDSRDRNLKMNLTMADYANQQNMADQAGQSALFGAIGGLGSSIMMNRYYRQSPTLFGSSSNTKPNTFETDSYNSNFK